MLERAQRRALRLALVTPIGVGKDAHRLSAVVRRLADALGTRPPP